MSGPRQVQAMLGHQQSERYGAGVVEGLGFQVLQHSVSLDGITLTTPVEPDWTHRAVVAVAASLNQLIHTSWVVVEPK